MASLCSLIRKPLKTSVGYSGFHFSLLISLLTKLFACWCLQEYSCDWSAEVFSHKCREKPLAHGNHGILLVEWFWHFTFQYKFLLSNIFFFLHIKIKKMLPRSCLYFVLFHFGDSTQREREREKMIFRFLLTVELKTRTQALQCLRLITNFRSAPLPSIIILII